MLRDYLKSTRKEYLFFTEMKKLSIVVIFFLLVSVYKIYTQKQFTYKTIEEIIQLILPFAYAFLVVNLLSMKDVFAFMKVALTVSFCSYFVVNYSVFLDFWDNITKISFSSSFSPFESSDFAEIASGLSAFFMYYRKKCPGWALLSILFVAFTFKRVFLIQCLALILLILLHLEKKRVGNWFMRISVLGATAAALFYNYLIQPENADLFFRIFGQSSGDFTMGRCYRIWYPLSKFESYGFGSTSAVLGYNLEMDLVKILMEIGVLGLFLFIWCYFSLGKKNLYTYTVMGMMLLNLLFASGLTSTIGWIARIIALAVISNENSPSEEHVKQKTIRFVTKNSSRRLYNANIYYHSRL